MDGKDLRKNLVILSAPSATGKNTVYNAVKKLRPDVKRVITATTREPRKNEKNGVDYYFITEEEFQQKKKLGEFVESDCYDGECYATPYSEINKYPETTIVFLIINTNGMRSVKEKFPFSKSIFLMPPSIEELYRRIQLRGDNTPEDAEKRISMASVEISEAQQYDYVIVNYDVEVVAKEIVKIIKE